MRNYLYYIVLLIVILFAAASTWGELHKTILYGIAVVGILGLTAMKVMEDRKKNSEDYYLK